MRAMMRLVTIAGMMAIGAGFARAQDATAMAMQAAQQTTQISLQAAQQASDMAMQATQIANQNAMLASQLAMENSGMPARPPLPMTPQPVVAKVKGTSSVVVYDADPKAIVFYTTDGSTPTLRSQRYGGPIAVRSTVRVRAMAFDLEDMPSGVVSRTIRVKS